MIAGPFFILYKFFQIAKKLIEPIVFFRHDLKARYGAHSWAVVTGASDGIGKAFCLELAREGFNIALIARNEEKLNEVEREIKEIQPLTETKIIIADFRKCSQEFFSALCKQLDDLDISILVNNVGVMIMDEKFTKIDPVDLRDEVIVNCIPQVMMTRYLLPKLLNREKRSAIINMSSTTKSRPRPKMAIYSASKVFVDFLSNSLAQNFHQIDWLSLSPGPVLTKMIAKNGIDFETVTADEFVKSSLKYLGKRIDAPGHYKHWMRRWLLNK